MALDARVTCRRGGDHHGVNGTRTNGHGGLVDFDRDDYQEGTCDNCRQLVYASRDANKKWTHWLVKWGYIIEEEAELF